METGENRTLSRKTMLMILDLYVLSGNQQILLFLDASESIENTGVIIIESAAVTLRIL